MLLPLPTETYLKVWRPTDLQMSADARWIAYAAAEPMVEKAAPAVYVVKVATGEAHRIALGTDGASAPRFAPDGRTLVFRSGDALYRVGVEGGRPRRAMALPKGTGAFEISPDGTQVAFTAPSREEPKKEPGPKVVDADEVPTGLFVASLQNPKPRLLTAAYEAVGSFAWAPAGATLAVGRTRKPNAVRDETRFALIDPTTGKASEVAEVRYPYGDFAVGPDGRTVAWVGPRGEGGPTPHDVLLRRPDGTVSNVSGDLTTDSVAFRPDGAAYGSYERGFGGGVFELDAGRVLRTVPFEGGMGNVVSPRSGAYAFVASAPTAPSEVYVSLDGNPPRPVTHLNDALRPSLVAPRRIEAVSDGRTIESNLYLPPASPLPPPLVALPHGGPTGRSVDAYDAWAQALVAHGYAVLETNFRGSTGYGWEFVTSNRGDWGGGDYRDMMASVDAVIAQKLVDKDRLGIFGWSYGGYMAAWAVGQTTRFKASVIGAPMTNLVSEFGTENQGVNQYDAWFHVRPWDDLSTLLRESPLVYVKNVRTPCLLLQGEADDVDPAGQSLEFYRALRYYGVEAQLVLYPGEPHGFRKPKDRIDVIDRTIAFLGAHVR